MKMTASSLKRDAQIHLNLKELSTLQLALTMMGYEHQTEIPQSFRNDAMALLGRIDELASRKWDLIAADTKKGA